MRRGAPKAVQADLFKKVLSPSELGLVLRNQALDHLELVNAEWLTAARNRMAEVCIEKGSCSSDDCWELCPPPADAHHNVMGCLFRDSRFIRVTATQTKRASGRARWISVYELKHEPQQQERANEQG